MLTIYWGPRRPIPSLINLPLLLMSQTIFFSSQRLCRWWLTPLLLLLLSSPAPATSLPPDQLIRQAVSQLIDELTAHRAELETDQARLYAMVERTIVPHIAFDKVARLILGNHWKSARPEQRSRFAGAFKSLLIHTYATAIFGYTGAEEILYKPFELKANERLGVVPTDVILPGTAPVPVNYFFLREKSGQWKMYDIQIDGVSLVLSYRNQYRQVIEADGLDSLIESLARKNAKD